MLERSKNAGLFLDSDSFSGWSEEIQKKFIDTKHVLGLRTLSLPDIIRSKPFGQLPELSLKLHALKLVDQEEEDLSLKVVDTRTLRTLSIRKCCHDWFSMSFPALTVLRVYSNQSRPSLNRFLEVLQGISALRVLDMNDSLPFANEPIDSNIDPVDLPNLDFLQLSSSVNPKEVTNVLPFIVVSSAVTLKLQCTSEDPSNTEELKSSLSIFFSRMNQGTTSSYNGLAIRKYSVEFLVRVSSHEHGFPLLQLTMPTFTQWPMILQSIPFPDLTMLDLYGALDEDECGDIFDNLPLQMLKHIELQGHEALLKFKDANIVFPYLKYLTIYNLDEKHIGVLRSWPINQSNNSQHLNLSISDSDIGVHQVRDLLKYTRNLLLGEEYFPELEIEELILFK